MSLPLVSVMIPTYNQENYICDAVESVLNQTYSNLEIIIADDKSTDNTQIIVSKYLKDNRIKYIRNKNNLGRVGNYHNTLYHHTNGEWIINLDGDDYFVDNYFIEKAINEILNYDNVICFLGSRHHSKKLEKYKKNKIDKNTFIFNGSFLFENWFKIGFFSHPGTIYKKELVLKDNLCYTFQGLQSDAHGIIRYFPYGNVIVKKVQSYYWRDHGNNASHSNSNKYFYKMERGFHEATIKDMNVNLISKEIGEHWIQEGKIIARRRYIINRFLEFPNIKYLIAFLCEFNFTLNSFIILIKGILNIFKVK